MPTDKIILKNVLISHKFKKNEKERQQKMTRKENYAKE